MVKQRNPGPLNLVCHPYLFALKEGLAITDDLLDYNLLLLQRNCAEIVKSPKKKGFPKPNLQKYNLRS